MNCEGHTDWVKRRHEMQGSYRLGKEKTRNARVMPIGLKRRHEMQVSYRLGKEKM